MSVLMTALEVTRRAAPLVPVFFCIDSYLGTIKPVGGRSMQPTFNSRGRETHDVVVLDRWTARQLSYHRGDVVVLRSPEEPSELLTKRVVGLPGDIVRPRIGGTGVQVPRGQLWVEGDNPHASNDSTSFGAVAAALVEARVCYKLWPPNEAGPVVQRELAPERLLYRSTCNTMAAAASRNAGLSPWQIRRM